MILLAVASVLLGAKQYFGDPIECNVLGLPAAMMDWYCWVHGTWTVKELVPDRFRNEVSA